MHTILERASSDTSKRTLLFGFLVSCFFAEETGHKCPLVHPRNVFSLDEKYVFAMNLSGEHLKSLLMNCNECYEKRCKNKSTQSTDISN